MSNMPKYTTKEEIYENIPYGQERSYAFGELATWKNKRMNPEYFKGMDFNNEEFNVVDPVFRKMIINIDECGIDVKSAVYETVSNWERKFRKSDYNWFEEFFSRIDSDTASYVAKAIMISELRKSNDFLSEEHTKIIIKHLYKKQNPEGLLVFLFFSLIQLSIDDRGRENMLSSICNFAKAIGLKDNELCDILYFLKSIYHNNEKCSFTTKIVPMYLKSIISIFN